MTEYDMKDLAQSILDVLRFHGPLGFRKLEAHLVLAGVEETVYDMKRALARLQDHGKVVNIGGASYALASATAEGAE